MASPSTTDLAILGDYCSLKYKQKQRGSIKGTENLKGGRQSLKTMLDTERLLKMKAVQCVLPFSGQKQILFPSCGSSLFSQKCSKVEEN